MADQTNGSNGSKGGNERDWNRLARAEAHQLCERLLEFGAASAGQAVCQLCPYGMRRHA